MINFRMILIILCSIYPLISVAQEPTSVIDSYQPAKSESRILKVRDLLIEKQFIKLNNLLDAAQKNVEQSIVHEEKLFTLYRAFEINDNSFTNLLNEWVQATPENYQPYLARASHYYRMGWVARGNNWASETKQEQFNEMKMHFIKAQNDIARTLDINEFSLIPYYLVFGIAQMQGGLKESSKVAKKALSIYPSSYILRLKILNFLEPRWGGSYDQMLAFIDEALMHEAENKNIGLLKGYLYAIAGKVRTESRLYNEAEKFFKIALQFGEEHKTLKLKGRNNYKREDYSQSIKEFSRAIALYPDEGSYYLDRARAFSMLKKYENALSDVQMADKLDPNSKSIKKYKKWLAAKFVVQGYDLNKNQKTALAIKKFNAALLLNPADAETYNRRANAYIAENKIKLAHKDLKKSLKLDPNNFNTYTLLDWVLAKRKAWHQIIRYWDQYITLHPDNSRAYVERGGAYYHSGNIKLAVNNAKIAADMGNHEGREAYEKFKHMAH